MKTSRFTTFFRTNSKIVLILLTVVLLSLTGIYLKRELNSRQLKDLVQKTREEAFRNADSALLHFNDSATDKRILKTSSQWKDSVLAFIVYYDPQGKRVFQKEDQGAVVMMYAFYYDDKGREIKTINAHSNVGFSVHENEYDSVGNEIRVYGYNKIGIDSPDTIDPFMYVSRYKNATDLQQDETVEKMIGSGKKYLVYRREFNQNRKMVKEVLFGQEGKVSQTTWYDYDSSGNLMHFKCDWGEPDMWDIYYKYDNRNNIISSKRVNFIQGLGEVHTYTYDQANNMLEDRCPDYYSGKMHIYKTEYVKNKPVLELFYEQPESEDRDFSGSKAELQVITSYKYDRSGNRIWSKSFDRRSNKHTTYKWQYEYY